MTDSVQREIELLVDCLERICRMANVAGTNARIPEQPKDPSRFDLYALVTLGAVYELARGVLEQRRAGHIMNAGRLTRHLFEFDVDTWWVAQDPGPRTRRRIAEELRPFVEGSLEPPPGLGDLEEARRLVDEERAALRPSELGPWGSLVPSRRQMAKEAGPLEDYDRRYAEMSRLAHPGLAAGGKFVRLVDEEQREIWKPPPDPISEVGMLAQAAHSASRCLGRLAPAIGTTPGPAFVEISTTVKLISQAHA